MWSKVILMVSVSGTEVKNDLMSDNIAVEPSGTCSFFISRIASKLIPMV